VTASSTATSGPTAELAEPARRRPGADGIPVRLADGASWLLAVPRYRAGDGPLTDPDVDDEIDRLFDRSALCGEVALVDVWSAARTLLRANYELSDDEFASLVSLAPGSESLAFSTTVVEALFGPAEAARSYSDWARASLLANGIVPATIRPGDLANVLAILVATKRTIPAAQFIDASRAAQEQASLETLI
jgi:hypothetical protein